MEKEAVKEAVEEVNWSEYFASIRSVCPWSRAYWARQQIHIDTWQDQVLPLQPPYVARIYLAPQLTARQLYNLQKRFNRIYPDQEWLYSHPKFRGHSTPIPVLIQQDFATLAKARDGINNTNNDPSDRR